LFRGVLPDVLLIVCVCERERERERPRNIKNEAVCARFGLLRHIKFI
jgi:hypothetical protein